MLSHIMSLYFTPSAMVMVNGICSERLSITIGTHQGCPLLPLLFTVVIEHLAQAIRRNFSIHGIHTPSAYSNLSLYADDLLLEVTQPHISLPFIIAEIH